MTSREGLAKWAEAACWRGMSQSDINTLKAISGALRSQGSGNGGAGPVLHAMATDCRNAAKEYDDMAGKGRKVSAETVASAYRRIANALEEIALPPSEPSQRGEARKIVEQCARLVEQHATEMRMAGTTMTARGVSSIARGLLSRWDHDQFGLAAPAPKCEAVSVESRLRQIKAFAKVINENNFLDIALRIKRQVDAALSAERESAGEERDTRRCPNGLEHGNCLHPDCVSSCPGRWDLSSGAQR